MPYRILHTMLRVASLERSLAFYVGALGMEVMRREEYPDGRFTLAFVGYGDERGQAVIELTHNWDQTRYERGDAFGHIALGVGNAQETTAHLAALGVEVTRPPGPMKFGSSSQVIAFVRDPDGYFIELVQGSSSREYL